MPASIEVEKPRSSPDKKGSKRHKEEKEEHKTPSKEKEREPKDLIKVFDDPIASTMAFLTLGSGQHSRLAPLSRELGDENDTEYLHFGNNFMQ